MILHPDGRRYLVRNDFTLSPGIDSPVCGWRWIETRLHPPVDCTITISGFGVRSTANFRQGDPRIMREYMREATRR
jgi:hypothetical protein